MPKANNESDAARRGFSRDLHRLKQGSTATASELREFVGQMRGRNPQEVLGAVAQSSLIQSVVLATVASVALMAVMTVVPYFLAKNRPPVTAQATPATQQAPAATPAATQGGEPAKSGTADKPTGAPTDASQLDDKTLKRLGVEESKSSDASSNPLEDSSDDLLKDLK